MNATVARCPCCSGPVSPTRLLVDIAANRASRNGVVVHLTPRCTEVLHLLNGSYPAPCGHARLMLGLFGTTGGPESTDTLKVHISRLRRVVLPLGLAITPVWGTGYLLVVDGPPTAARAINRHNPRWTARELSALRRYVIDEQLSVIEAAARLHRSPGAAAHKIAQLALSAATGATHG